MEVKEKEVEPLLERTYKVKEGAVIKCRDKTFKWDAENLNGRYDVNHVFTMNPHSITWHNGHTGHIVRIDDTPYSVTTEDGSMVFQDWHILTKAEFLEVAPRVDPAFHLSPYLLELNYVDNLLEGLNKSWTPQAHIEKLVKEVIPKRWVVCAANRIRHESLEDGELIIPSTRHYGKFMNKLYRAIGVDRHSQDEIKPRDSEQGFVDQWGEFMTRAEAYPVASRNGQILKSRAHLSDHELYSEMLY